MRQVTVSPSSEGGVAEGRGASTPLPSTPLARSTPVEGTSGVSPELLFATTHDIALLYEAKLFSDSQQDMRHQVCVGSHYLLSCVVDDVRRSALCVIMCMCPGAFVAGASDGDVVH